MTSRPTWCGRINRNEPQQKQINEKQPNQTKKKKKKQKQKENSPQQYKSHQIGEDLNTSENRSPTCLLSWLVGWLVGGQPNRRQRGVCEREEIWNTGTVPVLE